MNVSSTRRDFYHTVPYCCCQTGICSESTLSSPVLHSPPVHHHALLLNAAVASSRTRSKFQSISAPYTGPSLASSSRMSIGVERTSFRRFLSDQKIASSWGEKKQRFGAAYSTSNKLLLVARHIMATALQKCL